ncbi:MAG: hypothetical protein AAF202_12415, partial [Pseudomonadota bacterium]
DFFLELKESEIEAAVKGEMKGDWNNALGIHGFHIIDPSLQVGINETGSFDILIDGTFSLGSERVEIAADLVLSPEALFLPTALAFAGEVKIIDFGKITAMAAKMASGNGKNKKLKGGGFKGFSASLKEVHFLIMTPGAQLPPKLASKYNIVGSGFAMGAELWVKTKMLGKADGYVSDAGIGFDGTIAPFHLGPLKLKDAEIDIQAGVTVEPKLAMKGDISLFKGFEEKYELTIEAEKFKFYTDTKFGGLLEVELEAYTTQGLKVTPGNDLVFDSTVKAKFNKVFKDLTHDALKGLKKGDKSLANAQSKLKKAQDKVNNLKKKIADAKREADQDYDKAHSKIKKAKDKVDGLARKISSLKKKASKLKGDIKHDKKKWRFDRAAKHGVELAGVETAIGAETAAKKT